MTDLMVPVSVTVFAAFGIAYGWFLHSAVDRSLYKITGIRVLDSYVFSWLLGLRRVHTDAPGGLVLHVSARASSTNQARAIGLIAQEIRIKSERRGDLPLSLIVPERTTACQLV
jgi:hypothetical protein